MRSRRTSALRSSSATRHIVFLVAEQLAERWPASRIVLEPEGRNTAPAVALAALAGAAADDVLLVMPADHVIRNTDAFVDAVREGTALAAGGSLVTFGIVPTHAHTGYGYIRASAFEDGSARIDEFVEKPDEATAEAYYQSGEYFWNSGLFIFRTDAFLGELERHAPDIHSSVTASMDGVQPGEDFLRPDAGKFSATRSDSIDYAIMERTDNARVIRLDAGWSDVGSWAALHDILDKDESGNTLIGDVVETGSTNTMVRAEHRLVAVCGVADTVVVETKDAVLVTARSASEDVKDVVDRLGANGREETKLHRQVFRPWGNYDSVDFGETFQVKRLVVNPGAILSLQLHHHRAEHWVVVKGRARITRGEEEFDLGVNESTYIEIGQKHRIANPFDEPVHIIEVQCGDYLGEDDIVRFEDQYGREGTNT